jgi:hypothetical protein
MPSQQNKFFLDRRKFLSSSSTALAAIACSSMVGTSRFAWAQSASTETVEAKTAYGRLRGTRKGDLVIFKGIPYSQAGSIHCRPAWK